MAAFRHVQPVQGPAFRVDRAFPASSGTSGTWPSSSARPPNATIAPGVARDRDHQPVPEPVRPSGRRRAPTTSPLLSCRASGTFCVHEPAVQRVSPGGRRVAVAEGLDGLGCRARAISSSRRARAPAGDAELLAEERSRLLVQLDERLALGRRRAVLRRRPRPRASACPRAAPGTGRPRETAASGAARRT